jgi:hypothetical protein
MSLEQQVGDLVVATNALTQEVIDKLGVINTTVSNKMTEIDGYWVTKEGEIDTAWALKEAEINERLADFDNQEFFAAPTVQGTGDGLSSANATTLQDIIDNKITKSVVNIIHLSAGLHLLTSGTTIEDGYVIKMDVDGVYSFGTPPIIITPHTTDADISIDETGDPNPSQTCTAHAHDEFPLHLINCTLIIENIHFRGTRRCILAERSRIISLNGSDLVFNTWVHSLSCTSHAGSGLVMYDSVFIGNNDDMLCNIYHPDYTTCGDSIVDWVSPIVCDQNSQFLQRGDVIWNGTNIPINEYPGLETPEFRAAVPSSIPSAIQSLGDSKVYINKLTINGVRQIFYAKDGDFHVNYLETVDGSNPLQWIGQAHRDSKIVLTNDAGAWPSVDDVDPLVAAKAIKIENINANPDLASLLLYDGAKLYIRGAEVTTTNCACGTLITTDKRGDVIANALVVKSPDRAGNQGFMQVLNTGESRVELENCDLTTRQGDNDTAIVTGRAGLTTVTNLTATASTVHTEFDYGRYLDDNGYLSGGHSFSSDVTFNIPTDFATEQAALDFLIGKTWASDINVTILLDSGIYNRTSTIINKHQQPIILKGAEPLQKNITALGTVSGSSGNWTVDITLSDVSGISINQYVLIWLTEGTGIHQAHKGVWKITNINANTISVTNTNQNISFPSSTLTGGTVYVLQSEISSNAVSVISNYGNLQISNLLINGNLTSLVGIEAHTNAKSAFNNVGIVDVNGDGIFMFEFTSMVHNISTRVAVCNCVNGIVMQSQAFVKMIGGVFSGNSNYGIYASYNSNGEFIYSPIIRPAAVGNGSAGIYSTTRSVVRINGGYIQGNLTTDYIAANVSSIIALEYTNPSATFSPIKDTVGNNNSIIITV